MWDFVTVTVCIIMVFFYIIIIIKNFNFLTTINFGWLGPKYSPKPTEPTGVNDIGEPTGNSPNYRFPYLVVGASHGRREDDFVEDPLEELEEGYADEGRDEYYLDRAFVHKRTVGLGCHVRAGARSKRLDDVLTGCDLCNCYCVPVV